MAAGEFAHTGSSVALRRSLGHYVRTGYGGAGTAARRFEGTAHTAGSLYSALAPGVPDPADAQTNFDRTVLSGRPAREIMDAVVEAVRPSDGTQDAEASREAVKGCLSDVLVRYPEADLLGLNDDQIAYAIQCYVALDVFQRFALDLGKAIQDKAPSASVALSRLKDVRDYIKQVVAAEFRRLADVGQRLRRGQIRDVVRKALVKAFEVFGHYRE